MHLNYKICALCDLHESANSFNPSHIVSLVDPGMEVNTHTQVGLHKTLHVYDLDVVDNGTLKGNPHPDHIHALIDFGKNLPDQSKVLFHCVAGRRRSAAAALICDLVFQRCRGKSLDRQVIQSSIAHMVQARGEAQPNKAFLQIADSELHLQGALVNADLPKRYLDLSADPADD